MTSTTVPTGVTPPLSALVPPSPWQAALAIFQREMTTLWRNRFLQVFCVLAVGAGVGALVLTRHIASVPYFILQVKLYLLPLFAILTSVSSAHGEAEEQALLMSQPIPRSVLVLGKWLALCVAFGVAIALAVTPMIIAVPQLTAVMLPLGLYSAATAVALLAMGLAVGFSTADRVKGLIGGLLVWLFLLVGYDLLAYAAAQTRWVEQHPGAWLVGVLFNPLDSLRVTVLFSLEQVPFTVPGEALWIGALTSRMGAWTMGVCAVWAATGIALACKAVRRM